MNKFKNFGIRIRKDVEKNYYAIWENLKTIRLDLGPTVALESEKSEFYDVGLGTRCNLSCNFCYTSASGSGKDYTDICSTWDKFINTFKEDVLVDLENTEDEIIQEILQPYEQGEGIEVAKLKLLFGIAKKFDIPVHYTEKPFQIAIGSVGEGTIHPDFCKFLETVYNSGVVPNYTTNGITLSNLNSPLCQNILEATRKYVGGVAVSYGNISVRDKANQAIQNLIDYGECKVMIHHLISDKDSVEAVISAERQWKGKVHYHVLLPLMKHGRSSNGMEDGVFEYMAKRLEEENITNVAFGANFLPYIEKNPNLLKVWEYPREVYSKNMLLKDGEVIITPSSYNLTEINRI